MSTAGPLPQVTVLLATLQGRRWLPELLDSVLGQQGVAVHVVVSDDGSSDGTWEYLVERAAADPRVTLLPQVAASGSAAGNFYRLLRDAPLRGRVAFADQDDVWEPDKLARHTALLGPGVDGISSNVWSVHPDGSRSLLRKDYPQRKWDWVFEGPGPGCSFLLSPRLAERMRELVSRPDGLAQRCDYHDWLVYAVCRASGWRWVIDSHPSLDYRQHTANVLGANQGRKAAVHRLQLAREGWHRRQAGDLLRLGEQLCPDTERGQLTRMLRLLERGTPPARVQLAARAGQARRRPRDRALFGLLVLGGIW